MNVLSCFDGMSCGRLALERTGIRVDNYYASEVDKYAIRVAQKNYMDTKQVGDICSVTATNLPKIDLLIGGSPCQGFSFAGKQLNFSDPRSALFFEFVRLYKELKEINSEIKFFLENVKMKKEYQDVISGILEVEPIELNSSLVSAQNRVRLYWTNIISKEYYRKLEDKNIYLKDVLEENVSDKYYHSEAAINYMNREVKGGRSHWDFMHHSDTYKEKSACITSNFRKGVPYNVIIDRNSVNQLNPYSGCSTNQPKMQHRIYSSAGKNQALTSFSGRTSIYPDKEDLIRKLTPIECERLQTLPDNYTEGVSDTQRYKMIGNGWNVDTIVHFFKNL